MGPMNSVSSLEQQWPAIRRLFWNAFLSSVHCAIASVDEQGNPHVTPIGTVILRQPGVAIYFEQFTRGLPTNLKTNSQVCVLAVNSGRLFWLRSLLTGHFPSAPAVRLYGTVGELRPGTEEEIRLWRGRVWPAKFTKGYKLIWADMTMVREIHFTHAKEMNIPTMPGNL